ncbi:MAG: DNA topoisomerase IV subunit A [Alphaproteobacteria bacterium]|nr:DNA topoisomerase IV subunit A [Alphaproteobacteria bacterium]
MADDFGALPPDGGRIIEEPISDALAKRYLAYALSTITSRALPDVRDGLKPVHRRILYVMRRMGLGSSDPLRKSAKVVGDVMGGFHPHGDQAIYDAMVRLAQDFSVRYPLVDGQGNFGNIDGDNPAAMRYTESRLTRAAELLLEGIDENAVDFRETYDGQDEEPVVLPGGFPNLLANGASGIAVGMATSIPPHNAAELIDACLHLIAKPDAAVEELIRLVPGPDLPTGGQIVEGADGIREAYTTGRGGFRVRARWEVEELARGQWRILVTEIPYQVQKAKLIAALADLVESKKAPLVADVRDESAETIRILIEPRSRTVEPQLLMESLFKLSELESRVPLNMNVLDGAGAPRLMGLKDVLVAFLAHQRAVLQRRTAFRLDKIAARLEILTGLLIVYLNLDEVIRIIRNQDEPKPVLVKRFKLTDTQAEAILNTRLRALRKLEEMELRKEEEALKAEQAGLLSLLASEAAQWSKLASDLKERRKLFGPETSYGRRRTALGEAPSETGPIAVEAFVAKEPVTVVLSQKGWLRALKGRLEDLDGVKFKDDDAPAFVVRCDTTDKLLAFASDGRAFTFEAHKLPGGRGAGEPIRLMIELGEEHEIIALFAFEEGDKRLVASSDGFGFIAPAADMLAQKRGGKQVLNLSDGARAIAAAQARGDLVASVGENRKILIFPLAELPEMSRGKGVKLQTFVEGGLADVAVFAASEGLSWVDSAARVRAVPEWENLRGKRAAAGRPAPKGFSRSGRFDDTLGG